MVTPPSLRPPPTRANASRASGTSRAVMAYYQPRLRGTTEYVQWVPMNPAEVSGYAAILFAATLLVHLLVRRC